VFRCSGRCSDEILGDSLPIKLTHVLCKTVLFNIYSNESLSVLHQVVTECPDILGESTGSIMNTDSVVDIATRLWAELSGVQILVGTRYFSLV
jgi:hypothetical protein